MAEIKLQFVLGGGNLVSRLCSNLIAMFSAGHLSHVDAVIPVGMFGGNQTELLLGARSDAVGGKPRGVQIRPPGYASFRRVCIATIPCTEKQASDFYTYLFQQIGKPYDWRAIVAFAIGRNWHENDSWICSELDASALESSGLFGRLYLRANKITPVALALAVSVIHGATFEDTIYPMW